MGLFDCRCMATGVSLKGANAALVLLQPAADHHVPIALAIKGTYNRLGSLDGIEEDANTQLVLQFFLDRLRFGAFRVDEESLADNQCFPIHRIEDLLQGFERNINDGPGNASLHGQPVVFALIARAVWDAIAQASPPTEPSVQIAFEQLFAASPVAAEIYAGAYAQVAAHVAELTAVDSFLNSRGFSWGPSEAAGQDYAAEMCEYLSEALQTFSDSPMLTEALRRYEDEVRELLVEE